MDWINYHHLLYFWMVAREGTIVRASRELRLAEPTVSGQVRALEKSLGEKLFQRAGRRLEMTDTGRLVFRYAEEIFSLGRELTDTLKGRPSGRPLQFRVGIADVLPKRVTHRLLEPALLLPEPIALVCFEDKPDRLLAGLSLHELDLVLSDAPAAPEARVRAFSHLLGECGVTVFGAARLAARYRRNFPRSLDGAPFLFPADNTTLRRSLGQWFNSQGIRPKVAGQFQDSALLKVFGETGHGVFAAPSATEAEVRQQHRVQVIGRLGSVRERFYAISVERKVRHPAVVAIIEAARVRLFV